MDLLGDLHSWVRWPALAAVVGAVVIALLRHSGRESVSSSIYGVAVVALDVQVLLGILLWTFDAGWDMGTFFKAFHPLAMLLALAAAHGGVALAGKRPRHGDLITLVGFTMSLVLVVFAIPWDRL